MLPSQKKQRMSTTWTSSQDCFHPIFDLQRWSEVFPLDRLRREAREFVLERRRKSPEEYADDDQVERHVQLMSPHGEILVGPQDLAVTEQLRREIFAGKEVEAIPTAAFVFAKGEPPDRRMTKLGGLPFRRADKEWPCGKRGQSLVFVGQLNFTDIPPDYPSLPSEILLVFADPEDPFDIGSIRFEWVGMDLSGPLAHDVPSQKFDAVFGVMHKTWDILVLDEAELDRIDQYLRSWLLLELQGTKIAGCPSWIQDDETPDDECIFIGALGSISCAPGKRWPWVNVEEPIQRFNYENMLMWGDMGSLYLFWNGRDVLPVVQSY